MKINKETCPVGYYVEYLVNANGFIDIANRGRTHSVICIGQNDTAMYCKHVLCESWSDLVRHLAPTLEVLGRLENLNPRASDTGTHDIRYEFYPTWQNFVNNCQLIVSPCSKQQRSPNDNFSPL